MGEPQPLLPPLWGCPLWWFSSFVRASQGVLGCNLPCFNSAILALSLGAFFGGGLTVPSQFVGVLGCILPYFNSAKSALSFCLLGGFGIWVWIRIIKNRGIASLVIRLHIPSYIKCFNSFNSFRK